MTGLVDLMDGEHRPALEYDLMRAGCRLRDFPSAALTWGDLRVMVQQAQPDSALFKSMNPHWQRTPELAMLQAMEFTLRWLQWAQTTDAAKNRNLPEPTWLPWDERPPDGSIRGDVMDMDEAADWLGWTAEMNN